MDSRGFRAPLLHILPPLASHMLLRTATSFQGYSPGLGLSPGGSCRSTSPTHTHPVWDTRPPNLKLCAVTPPDAQPDPLMTDRWSSCCFCGVIRLSVLHQTGKDVTRKIPASEVFSHLMLKRPLAPRPSSAVQEITKHEWFSGLWMFPLHIQQLCLPACVLSSPLASTLHTIPLSLHVCLCGFVHNKETTVLIFVLRFISLISA